MGDEFMNANKRTEIKQNGFYSDHANTHKKPHVRSEGIYITELWFMISLKCRLNIIFCHQPLGAFINICIRQWHVILLLVMPSSIYSICIAVTSAEDITEPQLNVRLCSMLFPTF